jgi:hypothetical protein
MNVLIDSVLNVVCLYFVGLGIQKHFVNITQGACSLEREDARGRGEPQTEPCSWITSILFPKFPYDEGKGVHYLGLTVSERVDGGYLSKD